MGRMIETTCVKCGETIKINLGNATYSEALRLIDKLDRTPRECPGFHVELGSWKYYWNLEEVLENAYSEEEKEGWE